MKTFNEFENAIDKALDQQSNYIVVRVTREFWEKNVAKLSGMFENNIVVNINVDDDWDDPYGYVIYTDIIFEDVHTIRDLKKVVDRFISEGWGDTPVVMKDYDHKLYKPVLIANIQPGLHPRDDLYLAKDWSNAPKGEHVLIFDAFFRDDHSSD